MGNYVIGVGNYVSVSPSDLGNYLSADSQAPGEIADEVLIGPAGRAGAEHEIAARTAGQLPGAAGIARGVTELVKSFV